MKNRFTFTVAKFFCLMLALLALSGFAAIAFGAEGNPPAHAGGYEAPAPVPAGPANSLEGMIISVATPLLVAGARWIAPRIPKWALPIAAAAIGFTIDQVLPYFGAQSTGYGFLLGLAGVGVRELKKQISATRQPAA